MFNLSDVKALLKEMPRERILELQQGLKDYERWGGFEGISDYEFYQFGPVLLQMALALHDLAGKVEHE